MERIAIISATASYLLTSIKEQLEEKSYETVVVKADVNEIHDLGKEVDAYLLYLDEKLREDTQTLVYLRDTALEEDIPVFTIGSEADTADIVGMFQDKVIREKFYRPIDVKELSSRIETYLSRNGKRNKKKILVVDDSGAMLRNVKGWLESKYQIILANSGTMAIKYLSLNRPDLVLLDYEMPVINGKQVLEMIRSESEFQDIPVIFLTSKGDRESVMEVMSLKPEGYLLKTMPPEQIIRNVDDFFEKRKLL